MLSRCAKRKKMETEGKEKAGKCNYFLLDVSDSGAVLRITHADPLSTQQYFLVKPTLLALIYESQHV